MGRGQGRGAGPPAVVPDLVGRRVAVAHDIALDAGVLAVVAYPDAVSAGQVVVAQELRAGAQVCRGERVTIWVEADSGGGGSGGTRVPQGPTPLLDRGVKQLS